MLYRLYNVTTYLRTIHKGLQIQKVETAVEFKNMLQVLDLYGFKMENNKLIVKELAAFDGKGI